MGLGFKTILLDPPWACMRSGSKKGANHHYPLLKNHEIIEFVIGSGYWNPAPHSHMYLWVTNNSMKDGAFVMEALGYRFITIITWAKQGRPGLGQYFNSVSEHMLFGVRGRLGTRHMHSTFFVAPREGPHSVKPEASYVLIEQASPPPRLELFARKEREGWSSWGDEIKR